MKKFLMCLLLALTLTTSAAALEVPTNTVVQNLNGSQQLIKTYVLPPETDPQTLVEEPFEQEGYLYTFAEIVKEENLISDASYHRETVTVNSETDDLSRILEQLKPSIDYDDGTYKGTLALDHTSIHTEASGYETRSSTVTATKTIGPVDRNDMSYVPATTVKNGVTLKLSGVDWQVTGTDLVGDALSPSSYQAVASYSGKSYYKAATGYVTTADYVGQISQNGVESVTYQVKYLGTEGGKLEPGESGIAKAAGGLYSVLPYVLGGLGILALIVLAVLLVRSRREARMYQNDDLANLEHEEEEHE
ncbi:MAG: hypothetical protein HFG00_01670 [Oscillibacter sp.]|nr:hypothetical protein [Oscillibacter sp.]